MLGGGGESRDILASHHAKGTELNYSRVGHVTRIQTFFTQLYL